MIAAADVLSDALAGIDGQGKRRLEIVFEVGEQLVLRLDLDHPDSRDRFVGNVLTDNRRLVGHDHEQRWPRGQDAKGQLILTIQRVGDEPQDPLNGESTLQALQILGPRVVEDQLQFVAIRRVEIEDISQQERDIQSGSLVQPGRQCLS